MAFTHSHPRTIVPKFIIKHYCGHSQVHELGDDHAERVILAQLPCDECRRRSVTKVTVKHFCGHSQVHEVGSDDVEHHCYLLANLPCDECRYITIDGKKYVAKFKYTVTHACGHNRVYELSGRYDLNQERCARHALEPCDECVRVREKAAADEARLARERRAQDLPERKPLGIGFRLVMATLLGLAAFVFLGFAPGLSALLIGMALWTLFVLK